MPPLLFACQLSRLSVTQLLKVATNPGLNRWPVSPTLREEKTHPEVCQRSKELLMRQSTLERSCWKWRKISSLERGGGGITAFAVCHGMPSLRWSVGILYRIARMAKMFPSSLVESVGHSHLTPVSQAAQTEISRQNAQMTRERTAASSSISIYLLSLIQAVSSQ